MKGGDNTVEKYIVDINKLKLIIITGKIHKYWEVKMKKKAIVVLFSLFLVITLIAAPVMAATVVATDDFNRADGSLGPNWTDRNIPMEISGTRAQASGSGTAGWYAATYNSVTGTIVEGDVYHNASTALQFIGFLMDYSDTSNTDLPPLVVPHLKLELPA